MRGFCNLVIFFSPNFISHIDNSVAFKQNSLFFLFSIENNLSGPKISFKYRPKNLGKKQKTIPLNPPQFIKVFKKKGYFFPFRGKKAKIFKLEGEPGVFFSLKPTKVLHLEGDFLMGEKKKLFRKKKNKGGGFFLPKNF